MNILQRALSAIGFGVAAATVAAAPQASAQSQPFDMKSPEFLDYLRGSSYGASHAAMQNTAVLRCVKLICDSIGMLPLQVYENGDSKKKADTPLAKLLKRKPNNFQTPFEFKRLMQLNAMLDGKSHARIIWSGTKPLQLIPLERGSIVSELNANWEMVHTYTRKDGAKITLQDRDIFTLRDISLDVNGGLSIIALAGQAINLAKQAETAAARLFQNGMMVGGALKHPGELTTPAYERLKKSMEERYTGVENSHRWMILEEGMEASPFAQTALDSQHIENRNHQIEEIARAFGVPRPLLMMDDTSWGSGIEQLGIFFVNFTLQPWFTMWEQAIERSLFSDAEAERYYAKFNERALMRGTLKDQADFFAKALGSGGHSPWMKVNEVRDLSELSKSDEPHTDSLVSPLTKNGNTNEPAGKQAAGNPG